ncbi:metallophosphoesterase family protein [Geopsychrobacter electrodiphilus]|uniref:metallophosphoesterase family protein n=1 Tax=Geopsychrobacter electrodiphilus TaxID=225196 RepID=UPI00037D6F9F|nr:metallophosphoesterase family protein [Geopsychrobacter electrodiphilus]
MPRLIAIGDIHGQRTRLEELLEKVQPTETDQLVFLGDYIDRGPDSQGVVNRLLELHQTLPQTIFLKGNHEQMLLNALIETAFNTPAALPENSTSIFSGARSDLSLYLQNGGLATLKSYALEQVDELPRAHIAFLQQTRLYFHTEGFLFVHAGARNDLPLAEQDEYSLLWDRKLPPGKDEIQVVGHQPTPDGLPVFEEGRYSLDTGAGFGGPLTACEVRTRKSWQA